MFVATRLAESLKDAPALLAVADMRLSQSSPGDCALANSAVMLVDGSAVLFIREPGHRVLIPVNKKMFVVLKSVPNSIWILTRRIW